MLQGCPFANKWLNLAILWELLLLSLVVYGPVLEEAFGSYDLPPGDWLLVVGLAFTVVPVLELAKWLIRRFVPLQQVGELRTGPG